MKKTLIFFSTLLCMNVQTVMGAVAIKKAAPVATQQATVMDDAASLGGTVMAIVSGVKELTAKTNALTAECLPTSAEITFVDNIVKEWAKTGAATAQDVQTLLKRKPCDNASGTGGYQASVRIATSVDGMEICYDTFRGPGNEGMVWENFPKVGKATYCDDGSATCGKNQKTMSDIYEIFNLVDFTEDDYTPTEATMAGKLIAKIEKCSTAKLSQAKRTLWGNYLVETIGNLGQKTSTSDIMGTVSGVVNSGGGAMGGLSSIGAFISNTMNK